MSSNDNEDPTVAGGQFPEDELDRTVPSGKTPKEKGAKQPDDGLDLTMPSGNVPKAAGGTGPDGDGLDSTMPSGNVPKADGGTGPDGDGLDRTMPSGKSRKSGGVQMPSDGLDLTAPSSKVPEPDPHEDPTVAGRIDEPEEPTVASAGSEPVEKGEERTVPAMDEKGQGLAQSAATAPSELLGKTLGGCRIDKLLGRGAMGAVYKARQLKLDRDVAVKVIRPEMLTDPRMLKRFEVEARTVGKFNSAHVVMVHDVGYEQGVHYLVMEFVKGKNLREHVKLLAGGRLPAGEALPLIRQACKGLEEARRLGVVHRDIKPDNLMLTDREVLKIADFGIAKPQEDFSMTLTSELIGTPLYMSPEQCQGGANIDFRSDMYSLGATFFYLLTGEPPIRASSVYELIQTKTKLENLCLWKSLPELDENNPLSRVIERMTANDRDDRYESYEELLNDLLLVEAGETITVRAKKLKKAMREREAERAEAEEPIKQGSPVLMIVILLLLIGGGGGGYWWWSNQQKTKQVVKKDDDNSSKPRVDQPDPNLAKHKASIETIRGNFATGGPKPEFATELAALDIKDAGLAKTRDDLKRDVEAGLGVEKALAALTLTPVVPFDGLGGLASQIDRATNVSRSSGVELVAWANEQAKTRRAQLYDSAIATLSQGLKDWQSSFDSFGGDAAALEDLQSRMGGLRKGRSRLLGVLSEDQKRALDEGVAPAALDQLSVDLIRFVVLANANLKSWASDFVPADAALKRRRAALSKAQSDLRAVTYPAVFQAPAFAEVNNYRDKCKAALALAIGKEPAPEWYVERDRLGEGNLISDVVGVCAGLWKNCQDSQDEPVQRKSAVNKLKLAVGNAKSLFDGGDAGGKLDKAVPPDLVQQLESELDAAIAMSDIAKNRAKWLTDMETAERELLDLTFASWDAEAFAARAEELGKQLAEIEADPKASTLSKQLEDYRATCKSWETAKADYDRAMAQLSAGDLGKALATVRATTAPSKAAGTQLKAVSEIARQCEDAFADFARTLEISAMRDVCDAVAKKARDKGWKAFERRVGLWRQELVDFQNKVGNAVAVTDNTGQAFFVAETECSTKDFGEFIQKVRATGKTNKARWEACSARLAPAGVTERSFNRMIGDERYSDRDMVDENKDKPANVDWYAAAAYCAWNGYRLPSDKEWVAFARGTNREQEFPWGRGPADAKRVNLTSHAVSVRFEGSSWRANVHHVAGNMAEWLAAGKADRKAQLAGGGFMDPKTSPETKARWAAKSFDSLSKNEERADTGFRWVLDARGLKNWPK